MKNCSWIICLNLVMSLACFAVPQGPGDGGGGDTCNGKVIESFKTDVNQLKEYRTYILPIVDKISPPVADTDVSLRDLINPVNKNWYFVECKLKDVPKEKKGLYLDSTQTAFQNNKEIFVDAGSYSKLSDEEKSKLLLHETLMNLYLSGNLEGLEICQLPTVRGKCKDGKIPFANAPTKISSLSKKGLSVATLDDYAHQNIREMTDWLWKNRNSVTEESFRKMCGKLNFDIPTFYIDARTDQKMLEVRLPDIDRAFKKMKLMNTYPEFCGFDRQSGESKSKCKVAFDFKYKKQGDLFIVSADIEITRLSDKKNFGAKFKNVKLQSKEAVLIDFQDEDVDLVGVNLVLTTPLPGIKSGKIPKAGESTTKVTLHFRKFSGKPLELQAITFNKFRWYSFETKDLEKGAIKYTEVYGYNQHDVNNSDLISINKKAPMGVPSFDSKAYIGMVPR